VNDLAIASVTDTSVTLVFTEVDDGTGQPAKYDIRWAVDPISWTSASSVTNGSCRTPVAGTTIGARRSCRVLGLQPSTAYQFQMVAFRGTLDVDAVFGDLSNIASGTTSAPQATQLEFTGQPPASIVLNNTFAVEVTARDAQGATATTYSGTITLTLQGPVVAGGLSGTTSVSAVNGIATFSNLQVTGLCTSCTLKAAASGLAGTTSSAFVVVGP